ncbi:MAG: phosphoenolpyruvate carboxykinase [Dictyoglomaceae bacterium]
MLLDIEKMAEDGEHIIIESNNFCQNAEEVFSSKIFFKLLQKFFRFLYEHDSPYLSLIKKFGPYPEEEENTLRSFISFIKTIYNFQWKELIEKENFQEVLKEEERPLWIDFVEEFYNFWRKHNRFLIWKAETERFSYEDGYYHFRARVTELRNLVLNIYRRISKNISEAWPMVFRQLPAGVGVGMYVEKFDYPLPERYKKLKEIPFIQCAVLEPPLIYYPKRNYRKGQFLPLSYNPIDNLDIKPSDFVCYPAKVGKLLIHIYFHKRFMPLGSSLINLFEIAHEREIIKRPPDGILIFGVDMKVLNDNPTVYYEDTENNLIIAYIAKIDDVDYFGYFKKMTLTIHNLIMIERGFLPLHGAMARIELRGGKSANVVIIGDSGAGKSESLEAFRTLADKYLRRLIVIFDDMGSLGLNEENKVVAYGTEIGAFVRLDDLSPGYPYNEIDRSIFMNPHKTNARLVIPVTSYYHVISGYPVDLFLYANNYEEVDEEHPVLEFFNDKDKALEIFRNGARLSKGTTDETGLSYTYFANPFGAPQKREKHEILADFYFTQMLKTGVRIGQLRTRLGISGFETKGPEEAAKALFEYIGKSEK